MTLAEGLRLAAGGALMLGGLFVFITAVIGNFRFPNAAARMHSADLGVTLGILLIFAGLAVFGFSGALLLKLGLILVIMWISGPACSHLIAGMIADRQTDKKEEKQIK